MKIGLCAALEQAETAKALGFDYLETSAAAFGSMEEQAFGEALARVKDAGLPVLRCNCLFPGEISLMEDGMDRIAAWLQRAMARAGRLGAETVVFGSGRSRTRHGNMSYPEAMRRLIRVARLAGDCAKANGIRIAMEPLNAGETNMLNTLAETAAFAAAAEHPAVGLLADYYHIAMTGEPPEDLLRLSPLWHVHVAAAQGRRWPVEPEEGLARFLGALRQSGYDGTVSVEASSDNWAEDAPRTLRLLRDMTA